MSRIESQQPCTKDKSKLRSASVSGDNEAFVELHVMSSDIEHTVKDAVPMADRDGMDDLADSLARCMSKLVKEANLPSDQKTLREVRHFQPLVQEALLAVINRRRKSWSTSEKFDMVEVRQGTETTTPVMNFTRCNINSIIDISVVIIAEDIASVIGVCEVKKQAESVDSAIRQQICASLTKQRSVHRTDGSWLLPGLVVYADKAFITMMKTRDWWHYTAELMSVQRFDFSPVEDSLDHAYSLLTVLSEYACLLFSDDFTLETAFCDIDSLSYFTPSDTLPLHSSHIVRCKYKTVKKQLLREGKVTTWLTSAHKNDDDEVVVKTFTLGLYAHASKGTAELTKLLTRASELSNNPDMLEDVIEQMRKLGVDTADAGPAGAASADSSVACLSAIRNLHVWIGSMPDSKSDAIVTRFVGDRVCTNHEVLWLWKSDGGATRKLFYEQICVPMLSLIAHNYFHGDIRPPNVVVRVVEKRAQFTLIDWDDVRSIKEDRSVKNDNRYPQLSHVKNDHERSMLFTVCQLYVTAIIIDRVANNGENALDLEINEWKDKKNFWHVPETLQNKRKIQYWARERRFDELVSAMQRDTLPKQRSTDNLKAILRTALQI